MEGVRREAVHSPFIAAVRLRQKLEDKEIMKAHPALLHILPHEQACLQTKTCAHRHGHAKELNQKRTVSPEVRELHP